MKKALCAMALMAGLAAGGTSEAAPPVRPWLTLEMAETAVRACRTLAEAKGWRLAIAVLDASGDMVAFSRMDNARVKPIEVALLKAASAATTGRSTLDIRRAVVAEPEKPHGAEYLPGVVLIEGGEPIITKSGVLIGGIGVSGARATEDGECVRAGIAAIADGL